MSLFSFRGRLLFELVYTTHQLRKLGKHGKGAQSFAHRHSGSSHHNAVWLKIAQHTCLATELRVITHREVPRDAHLAAQLAPLLDVCRAS